MEWPHVHVQAYLEEVLKDTPNPTDAEIREAKQRFHKMWHLAYNRKRRKVRREYTLGFYPDVLKRIKAHKGEMTVSQFLYHCVHKALDGKAGPHVDKGELMAVQQNMVHLMAMMEEYLDTGNPDMEPLLERIEALEMAIHNVLEMP